MSKQPLAEGETGRRWARAASNPRQHDETPQAPQEHSLENQVHGR